MDARGRSLDELCDDFAQKARERKIRPVRLKPSYVEAVLRIEALPQNQSGADKSWVERSLTEELGFFSKIRRLR